MRSSGHPFWARLLPIGLIQLTGLTFGLISVRLTSTLVAPADNGIYGIFVSLVPLGHGVVFAGLLKFIGRQWLSSKERGGLLRDVLAAAPRKTLWLGLTCAAAAAVAAPAAWFWFAASLFATALLLSFAQLAHTTLQAAREHWRDFALSAAGSVTRGLAPPLLYAAGFGLAGMIGGFALHGLVLSVVAVPFLARHVGNRSPGGGRVEGVYEGPLFVALAMAGWIVGGMNRWIAAGFFGVETAGYFTLAANAAVIVPSMLGTIALQNFQPSWFGSEWQTLAARASLLRQVDRIALGYVALALGAAGALHVALPWLVGTLIDERYRAAGSFVLGAGFFTTAMTTGHFFHVALIAARRERPTAFADLAGAACFAVGGVASAAAGVEYFIRWLLVAPLVPWLVNRTVARRALLRPHADPAPALAR